MDSKNEAAVQAIPAEPAKPEPISGIQPIPLDVTAKQAAAEMKVALDRLRKATNESITAACDSARASRSSNSKRSGEPEEPDGDPSPDVTERFNAIRANVR